MNPDRRILNAARVLAVGLVVLAGLRLAWVSDDALITLRTALNLTHGWGPGFNATESVQAYTHPLWFLLWTVVGSLTGQWILGVFALSLVLTGIAVGLLVWRTTSMGLLIFAIALLLMSNAFMEYTTSGLENPLAYASIGVLLAMTLGGRGPRGGTSRAQIIWAALLGLTIAAVVLTRMDLVLIVVPVAAVLLWDRRRDWRLLAVAAAAAVIPLALWFIWSQATYASLLPNTFAAKRNVDIPATELVTQGLRYLWVTFEHDPVTLVALVLGVGGALALGTRLHRAWAVGVVLYFGYVVWIGGDFMAGRFMAVPVYVSVFLLATLLITPSVIAAITASVALLLGAVYAGSTPVALTNPQAARWEFSWNLNGAIADERGVWVGGSGRGIADIMNNLALAYSQPDFVYPSSPESKSRSLRELDKAAKNWPVTESYIGLPADVAQVCGGLGTTGIVSGPTVHLVDDCALTDRFLAEQPFVARDFQWRVGDYHRTVPDGYLEAIRKNDPKLMPDQLDAFRLAQLWEAIRPNPQ
jgi:arabinofuranosyltransferase